MLLRGILAFSVVALVALVSARLVVSPPPGALSEGDLSTLALAPISLGNPAAAANLRLRHPATPAELVAGPQPYRQRLRAEPGDTLAGILVGAGVSRANSNAVISALQDHFDPRKFRAGQELTLTLQPEAELDGSVRLVAFEMPVAFPHRVSVSADAKGQFRATKHTMKTVRQTARAEGIVKTSLYAAAVEAGVPVPVIAEMIRVYSWDVDFQRDTQSGDRFSLMYETIVDNGGRFLRSGDVVHATLTLGGKPHTLYRFITDKGGIDYFDEKGQSARKALLRTPIDGARLSSGYGRRRHPILGYSKMHRGVDFAAPRGTPIYAAGNGTVDYVGRKGAYGKYVRIRHNGTYSTAYAHLSRYAKGMRPGKRVRQRDVIGYVGSTGRSTGPHLHYEILRGGRQTNPLRVKMPSGRKLAGKELERFLAYAADVDRRFAALATPDTVADAGDQNRRTP